MIHPGDFLSALWPPSLVDLIIMILFVVNLAYFFRRALESIQGMDRLLHEISRKQQEEQASEHTVENVDPEDYDKVVTLLREMDKRCSLFENIASIFPLLGICGTVIALLSMSGNTAEMMGGFLVALTSTFWGLVSAIVCKVLDSALLGNADYEAYWAERFVSKGEVIKFQRSARVLKTNVRG